MVARERHLEDVRRIWRANEVLWNEKVGPVLESLNKAGGIVAKSKWEHIVAFAFGRSKETFQAIQLLCNPGAERNFWSDGFVLSRSLFETFITLEWVAQDSESRAILLFDEYILKEAHFLEYLEEQRDRVRPERQREILGMREEVLRRHNRGAGTLALMPFVEQRAREIAQALKDIYPSILWEYEVYYRDVSGFAHPSAWGSMSFLRKENGPVVVESTPEVGRKAVLCNGDFFLRIINRWNAVFEVRPRETVSQWQADWAGAIQRS